MTNNPTQNPRGNFKNTPNGIPGICTRIPLLWSEGVLKGKISRQKFVELSSLNAAKLYGKFGKPVAVLVCLICRRSVLGMYPKKGTIAPGSDADLIIWRSDEKRKPYIITQPRLYHAADYTPYEGLEIGDWPRLVLLRGEIAYDGEKNTVTAKPGDGRFIKRGFSTLP